MSLGRRIVLFPLTRLFIAGVMLVGTSLPLGLLFFSVLGFSPSFLTTELLAAIAALLSLIFVGKVIERRSFAEFGLRLLGAARDLTYGVLLGAGLMSAVIGVLAVAGWYRIADVVWQPGALLSALALFLVVSIFEEVLFRGIIFRIVEEGLGSWLALGLSGLLFGLIHVGNDNATLWAGMAIALEAGILLGAAYMLTRSLWLAIGIHWAWNFVQGPIFGAPVSGNDMPTLVQPTFSGPELWTGGAFGPEAGLVAIIICTIAGLVMVRRAVRRGNVVTPRWMSRGKQPTAEAVT